MMICNKCGTELAEGVTFCPNCNSETSSDGESSGKAISFLDKLYVLALNGIPPISESVSDLADEYKGKYSSLDKAINRLIENQIIKCGTSGFLTGLGGIITLPITLPANISSVLYVQMRMVACVAYLYGHNPHDDNVKTFVYACLTGKGCADILKAAGIKFGEKAANVFIRKIPIKFIHEINRRVGFRFMTKFGEKGIVNMGKVIPFVGGFIGGTFDVVTTRVIAAEAKKLFSSDIK